MTKPTLTQSAQVVQDVLVKSGVPYKVVQLSDSTRTAQEAADTIGCHITQIVKSLVFRTKLTHKPILVLASGLNRVNEKVIEKHFGEKIEKADAAFTKEITGFAIGGISPIGHKQKLDTLIDEDLLQYTELWAAAGTPNAVFNLKPTDLKNLTGGKIIKIK